MICVTKTSRYILDMSWEDVSKILRMLDLVISSGDDDDVRISWKISLYNKLSRLSGIKYSDYSDYEEKLGEVSDE